MAGINTGSSVVGVAFDGGVIIAADTLVSFGKMARHHNCDRIMVVNDQTVVAATGDYADYQYLTDIIEQKQIEEEQWNDGIQLGPKSLHSWVTRVAYNRRSKFEPLWCTWIIGGLQRNEKTKVMEPFLGFVDKLGTAFKSNVISTGFGQLLATPIIRELTESMDRLPTEEEARNLIAKCMEGLYLRDCCSWPKYHQVVIKADGVKREQLEVKGNWQIADYVLGY